MTRSLRKYAILLSVIINCSCIFQIEDYFGDSTSRKVVNYLESHFPDDIDTCRIDLREVLKID